MTPGLGDLETSGQLSSPCPDSRVIQAIFLGRGHSQKQRARGSGQRWFHNPPGVADNALARLFATHAPLAGLSTRQTCSAWLHWGPCPGDEEESRLHFYSGYLLLGEAEEAHLKPSTPTASPQPRPPQGSLRAHTEQVSSHCRPQEPPQTPARCLSDPKFPIRVHQSSGLSSKKNPLKDPHQYIFFPEDQTVSSFHKRESEAGRLSLFSPLGGLS